VVVVAVVVAVEPATTVESPATCRVTVRREAAVAAVACDLHHIF